MQVSSGNKEQFHWTGSSQEKNSQLGKYWPTGQLPPRQSKYDSHSLRNFNSICQHKQWQKMSCQIKRRQTNKSCKDKQAMTENTKWKCYREANKPPVAKAQRGHHHWSEQKQKQQPHHDNKINNSKKWPFLSLITFIVAFIKFQITKQRENFQSRVKLFLHIL